MHGCADSFIKANNHLVDANVPSHPNGEARVVVSLRVDCSNVSVGSVLEQTIDGLTTPLDFFSKKLNNAQTRYSTFDKELLEAYMSIIHFKHMLEGRSFIYFTDHKPIVSALNSKTKRTPRQTRLLEYITQFTN